MTGTAAREGGVNGTAARARTVRCTMLHLGSTSPLSTSGPLPDPAISAGKLSHVRTLSIAI